MNIEKTVKNKLDLLIEKIERNNDEDNYFASEFKLTFFDVNGDYLNDYYSDEDEANLDWLEVTYFRVYVVDYLDRKKYVETEYEYEQLLSTINLYLDIDLEVLDLIENGKDFEYDLYKETETYKKLQSEYEEALKEAKELTKKVNEITEAKKFNIVITDEDFEEVYDCYDEFYEKYGIYDETDICEILVKEIENDTDFTIVKRNESKSKYYTNDYDFKSTYYSLVSNEVLDDVLKIQSIRRKFTKVFTAQDFTDTEYNTFDVRVATHYN